MPWQILIADDEPKIRRGLRRYVEQSGSDYQVSAEASDGESAWLAITQHEPDIVLLDVRMPHLDGLGLLQRLAERPGARRILVISGHDEFEYARQALNHGAFEYLLKPVEQGPLMAAIDRAARDLQAESEKTRKLDWALSTLQSGRAAYRERFFLQWLAGELTKEDWQEYSSWLGPFPKAPARLALANPTTPPERSSLPCLALKPLADQLLQSSDEALCAWNNHWGLALLVPLDLSTEWETLQDNLEIGARDRLGLTLSVVQAPWLPHVELSETLAELLVQRESLRGPDAHIVQAANFLERHYRNPDLALEEVAAEIQVTAGHLGRLFKHSTGLTFSEYVNRLRVRKASVLLLDPSARMYQVAEQVGFRSQHYFSRSFRQVLGTSPSEFRQSRAGE